MKNKSTLIYLILFVLIGVASIFILHHTKKIEATITPKNTINTFIKGAVFTEYNKQGLIRTKITTKKVLHYQLKNIILFEKPFIITYGDDRTPWHIRADQAISDNTGEKIVLSGHVIAHELPTAHHAETTIKTTELTLFPKLSQAETDKPVVLTRPGTTIHGVGFTANLKTGLYQLHSQSEVIYQPTQKNKSR